MKQSNSRGGLRPSIKAMSTPTTELPIDCRESSDGRMTCVWRDDNDQQHALYYSKDKEFLFFNQESRHWVALLKTTEVSSATETGKPEAQPSRFRNTARGRSHDPCSVRPKHIRTDANGDRIYEWTDINNSKRTFSCDSRHEPRCLNGEWFALLTEWTDRP
jgi:hypothetical protein